MTELEIVLEYMPISIKQIIKSYLEAIKPQEPQIEEIRLRTNRPLSLKIGQEAILLDYNVKQQEVLQAFEKICESSVYTYKRQICEGYITIRGGNRVGIVGSSVIENGQVVNVNYISSLNFRIAKQKIGCSNGIIPSIVNIEEQSIYNTLIISPPRRRKNHAIKRHSKKFKQWI